MGSSDRLFILFLVATAAAAGGPLRAAGLVYNPSFEVNYNETWPHYGPIDGWTLAGGGGVNEAAGPFHNVGTAVPDRDRIAFIQGSGSLSQTVAGLVPGERHWIQFHYDARACCPGGTISLTVKWNGVGLDSIFGVAPAIGAYHFRNIPFTPDSDTGTLAFETVANGDATICLDAVTIVQRDEGYAVVGNPSFEASGPPTAAFGAPPAAHSGELFSDLLPAGLAGWSATGSYGISLDGGTYADNGAIPDGQLAGFLEGALSSFSGTISGLVPGTAYELSFACNARAGTSPYLRVLVDDEVLFEDAVDEVGGVEPYRTETVSFEAAGTAATVSFVQMEDLGTLLLDDIRVAGQVAPELPPLVFDPAKDEIAPGGLAEFTLKVPAELLAKGPVDLQLVLDHPERAGLVGADAAGVLVLHFDAGGSGTADFAIEGLGIGPAHLSVPNLADHDGLKMTQEVSVEVVGSFVRNASFEGSPVPPGDGYGPILAWPGGSGLNAAGGPFADNGVVPDRAQVAFLQGAMTLSQEIFGLAAGESHRLQFRYNARASGAAAIDLSVRFGGEEIVRLDGIGAVGDAPYRLASIDFVPAGPAGGLEFVTAVAPDADATLLLDAVSIVRREADEIVIENPSFEASGSPTGFGYLGPIGGWSGGSGINIGNPPFGPFADNGTAPDGDRVLFIQQSGSIRQLISGLTPGAAYSLSYAVNRRTCCDIAATFHSVSLGGQVLVDGEEVLPVGGIEPYLVKSVAFTADASEAELVFSATAQGDATLLLDDIRIVPAALAARFRRGDSDGSGAIDLTDPISTLEYLFLAGPAPGCTDAADSDDSGVLDLSDPIVSLEYLFLAGPPPPAPGPIACGGDPTDDALRACIDPSCP